MLVKELKKEAALRSQTSFPTSAPAEDTVPAPSPVRNQLCTACNKEAANWKCCSNAAYCCPDCFTRDQKRHGSSHEGASLCGDISYADGDPVTLTTDDETEIDEPSPQPAAVSVAPDAVSPAADTEEDVIMLDDDEGPAPK